MTAVKFDPAKAKSSWRPVKSKLPDCASYEFGKGKDFVSKSQMKHKFAPTKTVAGDSKETYTTIVSRSKAHVPGVGSYKPKIDYVAVPYGRKRL